MRKSFVGGNWKCNGTRRSIEILVESLNAGGKSLHDIDLVVAPTALHIGYVKRNINPEYKIAVQNIWSSATQGAFTGELTADIVKDFGIDWVILGHSERRHKVSNEDNHFLCSKVSAAVTNNLNVIYCIGETLKEKNENQTFDVCVNQLELLVKHLKENDWEKMVIAYEPVWAIGTGKSASPEEAENAHKFIRGYLGSQIGDVGHSVRIIYGGSVNPSNCKALIRKHNIDGFLVGGCSLNESFKSIIDEVSSSVIHEK